MPPRSVAEESTPSTIPEHYTRLRQEALDEMEVANYNVRTARTVMREAMRRKREVATYIDWLDSLIGFSRERNR